MKELVEILHCEFACPLVKLTKSQLSTKTKFQSKNLNSLGEKKLINSSMYIQIQVMDFHHNINLNVNYNCHIFIKILLLTTVTKIAKLY